MEPRKLLKDLRAFQNYDVEEYEQGAPSLFDTFGTKAAVIWNDGPIENNWA